MNQPYSEAPLIFRATKYGLMDVHLGPIPFGGGLKIGPKAVNAC
jgi:hypothetical protein